MAERIAGSILLALALAVAVAGCGQKGPLYLPETTGEVVTRPTQTPPASDTGNTSSSPQSVDSPSVPANPAPEVTEPETGRDKQKKDGATAPPR